MNNKQLIDVLTQALELANKAGVYTLKDSSTIQSVLLELEKRIVPKEEEIVETVEVAGKPSKK